MGLARFYKYNGFLMTVQYVVVRRLKKISNWLLARKLNCGRRLNIELFPYIRGLSYIKVGYKFTAGHRLRLEVTEHKREWQHKVEIGDHVVINDDVHIGCANRITIGNNVLIASKVFITDHNHGYYDTVHAAQHEEPDVPPLSRLITCDGTVEIGDNVWIGEFVSILPNTKIGRGSVIGCNSVVKGVIPEYSIAAGVPARVVKQFDFTKRCWLPVETATSVK